MSKPATELTAASAVSEPTSKVIAEVGPDDILFGRGAPIVNSSGNVRFRDLVNASKTAYASTRCRETKDSIARQIIKIIEGRNGKFLKEIKSADDARKFGVAEGAKAWIEADYDEVVEKVKQTLRENEKQNSNDPRGAAAAAADRKAAPGAISGINPAAAITAGTGNATDQFSAVGRLMSLSPLEQSQAALVQNPNNLLAILQQQQAMSSLAQQQQRPVAGLLDLLQYQQLIQQQQEQREYNQLLRAVTAAAANNSTNNNNSSILSNLFQLPNHVLQTPQQVNSPARQLTVDDYLLMIQQEQQRQQSVLNTFGGAGMGESTNNLISLLQQHLSNQNQTTNVGNRINNIMEPQQHRPAATETTSAPVTFPSTGTTEEMLQQEALISAALRLRQQQLNLSSSPPATADAAGINMNHIAQLQQQLQQRQDLATLLLSQNRMNHVSNAATTTTLPQGSTAILVEPATAAFQAPPSVATTISTMGDLKSNHGNDDDDEKNSKDGTDTSKKHPKEEPDFIGETTNVKEEQSERDPDEQQQQHPTKKRRNDNKKAAATSNTTNASAAASPKIVKKKKVG